MKIVHIIASLFLAHCYPSKCYWHKQGNWQLYMSTSSWQLTKYWYKMIFFNNCIYQDYISYATRIILLVTCFLVFVVIMLVVVTPLVVFFWTNAVLEPPSPSTLHLSRDGLLVFCASDQKYWYQTIYWLTTNPLTNDLYYTKQGKGILSIDLFLGLFFLN